MLFILIVLGAGGGVLATTAIKPLVKCTLPTGPQCPVNEQYVNCVLGHCNPKTCNELGYAVACPRVLGPCKGGCLCIENYLRDINGTCIPQRDCPSCGGDFNATSGCGNKCGRLCSNYNKPNNCSTLPLYCQLNGCDCKEGYVYDSVSERCMAPNDCPIPCNGDIFAERKQCPKACPPTCAIPNPRICNKACIEEGCQCRSGFLLGPDGKCIKPENCPDTGCYGDMNAIVRSCPTVCQLTCDNQAPRPCPPFCLPPDCECKYGYILSEQGGKCVPIDQCTNSTTCSDLNAIKKECALNEACKPTCAQPTPGSCTRNCVANGCECPPGLVLSERGGRCIKIEDCPLTNATCNGDPNAVIKANPLACPSTCDAPDAVPYCKKLGPAVGCECKPGYILSKDGGSCILPDQCPGGNPCGENANFVYCKVECPNSRCPVDDSRGIIACDPPYPCAGGCACKLNHKRSIDGKCILASNCPRVNCTRQNEVWSPCRSDCLREDCADVNNQPTTCNTLVLNCQPQCICKKGYFRNDHDLCVPASQCPNNTACSDPNAITKECAPNEACRPTCAQPTPGPCPQNCVVNGCECPPEFILSERGGRCIKMEDCPNQSCSDPNAERVECAPAPSCRATCAVPKPGPCILSCVVNECVCKKGYILSGKEGNCVPIEQCTKSNRTACSDPNAITKECALNEACRPTCAQPTPGPCPQNCVVNGCECPPEFILSERGGRCIKMEDCPNQSCSDPNAERVECAPAPSCRATCAVPKPGPCILSCVVNECVCKKGYILSGKEGNCVPIEQCTKSNRTACSDPNAITKECAPNEACRPTCAQPTPGPCPQNCVVNGCECPPEFILSERGGRCIKKEDCPNQSCSDPNAERVECAPAPSCRATCAVPKPGPCILSCVVNECVCKKGYILSGKEGNCVPIEQCTKSNRTACSDPNAITKECALNEACRPTCAQPTPGPCPQNCVVNGCECPPEFILSERGGRCIKMEDCPNQSCSDPNAERVECAPAPSCRATCAVPKPGPCILSCVVNECVCKKGYILSGKEGNCVPIEQCTKSNRTACSDPNAITKECAPNEACRPTCAQPTPGPCPQNCVVNGCECPPEFILSERGGRCIKKEDCPNQSCSDPNAERVECAPAPSCRATCAVPKPGPCILSCVVNECVCKKGYILSGKEGNCVPIEQCTKSNRTACSDPNAITKECAPNEACRPTCAQPTPGPCPQNCVVNGCECPPEFILSERGGRCIKKQDCPNQSCSDPNAERVECAPAPSCRATCAVPKPGPCILSCVVNECVCKKGYILSAKEGNCVPIEQCTANSTACSDPNAITKECAPNEACRPTCAQPTAGPCPKNCVVNGCECPPEFILSERGGRCIKMEDCPQPSCNGDPNAIVKACPLPCPSICARPNAIPCKKACQTVGCECKSGYILSEAGGKCILPDKCQGGNPCGRNETYVSCKMNCPSNYCPVNNSPNTVICEVTNPCYPGCVCKINYRRTSVQNPVCQLASECPPVKCGKNEEWSGCPSACLAEDCANVNDPPATCNTLLLNCQPKCICKKGYFRDSNRKCIPANQCPKPIKCKKNEVYNECSIRCPPQTCASIYSSYNCSSITICEPGCDCISEYLRNGTETDLCIPSKLCPAPKPGCGINEVSTDCYNECQRTCKNRIIGDDKVCTLACTRTGCICKPGTLKHDNGTCVPEDQCSPPDCPKGEVYTDCGSSCPTTCETRGDTCKVCPAVCNKGCFCAGNTIRAPNGTCVEPSKCPPRTCGLNEEFVDCPPTCPPTENCSNIYSRFNCSKPIDCCKPSCRCKPGLFRDSKKKCISSQACIKGNGARAVAGPGYAEAKAEAGNSDADAAAYTQ